MIKSNIFNKVKPDSKENSEVLPMKHSQSDNESEQENLIDINDLQEGIQADDEDND